AYNTRAGARLLLFDWAGARADANEALRLDPGMWGAYITRGNARYHLGDRGGADDYRRALEVNAPLAARGMVSVIAEQVYRDAAHAFADCEKHLQQDPKDFQTYCRRGLMLLLQGRDAEA